MCCHIFDRRSVAPSSGDFRRRPPPPRRPWCDKSPNVWRCGITHFVWSETVMSWWYSERCGRQQDRHTISTAVGNKIFNPIPDRHKVHFFTNQEAQLCLLLVLQHVLLPHLFHTPKFPEGSHLYVGAIQIEMFCLKLLEKWTEGKIHLFGIFWLKWNFNLHVQIQHGSFPRN